MKKMSVTDVELLGDLFFGPATVLGGSWLDDGALKQAAMESFPAKRSCVVREWMLLDVMLEDECQREMKGKGWFPPSCTPKIWYSTALKNFLSEANSDHILRPL